MKITFLFALFIISIISYSQDKRLALVIGNGIYEYGGTLLNPENDARAMANVLKNLGFEVMAYENIDQKSMRMAIDDFGLNLINNDVGLFFYAGHGVQVKGYNYLIPVDAKIYTENDVEYNCVEVGRVLAKMEDAKSKTNIVILDACRDNPFERGWTRSAKGKGLASMNAPVGSIIAYATAPGNIASDGPGDNGLYTSALLKFMIEPGLKIEDLFKKVRGMVKEQSNEAQIPWESTSLEGDFYFIYENQYEKAEENSQNKIAGSILSMIPTQSGSFIDSRDGQQYKWVRVGEQIWMAQNLNYNIIKGGCFCYDRKSENCKTYGKLYSWDVSSDACPGGWHLPGDDEWNTLIEVLGGTEIASSKVKEVGNAHWKISDISFLITNESGFTALPGGCLYSINDFSGLGKNANYWSSSIDPKTDNPSHWSLKHNSIKFTQGFTQKEFSFSVRCIKNP